jgi:hypothetical protein
MPVLLCAAHPAAFLKEALAMLRPAMKQLYIKVCLREKAPNVEVYADEIDPERYIVRA